MSYLPQRPTGLRHDQVAEWEREAADQYGPDDRVRPADPADVDPAWSTEGTRAIQAASKRS